MASSYFQWPHLPSWNYMQASLLLSVSHAWHQRCRGVYALDYYIRLFRFLNAHHLYLPLPHFDGLGERHFTYFTLKSVEIIAHNHSLMLFLYLTVYPLSQTLYMNQAAITFTVTWWYKDILRSFLAAKAHLTGRNVALTPRKMLLFIIALFDFIDSLVMADFLQVGGVSQRYKLVVSFQL